MKNRRPPARTPDRNNDAGEGKRTTFRSQHPQGQVSRQGQGPGHGPGHGPGQGGRRRGTRSKAKADRVYLYGMHTVRAALENPKREKTRLFVTENATARLNADEYITDAIKVELVEAGALNRLVGAEAVHQGVVLEAKPLPAVDIDNMSQKPLVLVLDQITDPHNVGAILRTAVAMDAGAVISTARNSAQETGVLAKSASGAVDMIDHIQIGNLARAIEGLSDQGYFCIGLDSDGPASLEDTFVHAPNDGRFIALVLGAEGQGLRKKTRETCNALARLDMPGAIKSLNVSNAAAISLYAARKFLANK